MDINKLADMADKIMEVAPPTVSALSSTYSDHDSASEVKQLHEEVTRLADLVASLTARSSQRSPSRAGRFRSPALTHSRICDALCLYHAKFGKAAKKCKDPCS